MKFKFNFRLDKRRKLDNGCFPIKVNLHSYNEGRNFDFSIPDHKTSNGDVIKLVAKNDEDFESIWSKKEKINNFGEITGEQYVTGRRNDLRIALKIQEDALKEIIERKDIITSKDVKRAFLEYKPKKVSSLDLIDCFDQYHKPLKKQERFSYATSIMATRNNLKTYLTKNKVYKPISLYDIRSDWLNQYETTRSKETGSDSINSDTKNIRTVYNYFKKDNEILIMKYPFGQKKDKKYQIKTTRKKNVALELDQVKRIFDFSSENYWYQMARDFWIFSYLAGGMNVKDMIYWTKDKLKKGYYVREKTKRTTSKTVQISIKLINEMPEIIKKYKGSGKYVFDVLNDNDPPEVAHRKYKSRWSTIRDQLIKFRELLDLPDSFGWQWARHSVAFRLSVENVSGFKIMDKLGHTDIRTTQNYIRSFKSDETEEEISDIIIPKKNDGKK